MATKNGPQKASMKSIIFCIVTSLLFPFKILMAQNKIDSVKKPLLGLLKLNTVPRFIIRKSNIVFPEILKGTEDQMLSYIEKFIHKRREYLVSMYAKGKNLLPKAASILKNYNLPEELKVLMTLESAYDGNAISKAGAVGYWQIMDEMAEEYGMQYVAHVSEAQKKKLLKLKEANGGKIHKTVAKIKDDRKNFNTATHAAARYLRDQSRTLSENWLLVVASYNCGAGNMRKAIKKSGIVNPTFWDIKNFLPSETRLFVMNFITLNVIFHNYEIFATNKMSFAPEKLMVSADLGTIMAEAPFQYSNL